MGVETTPLTIAFDGRCLIIARVSSNRRRKMVRSDIDEIHHEFGNALKKNRRVRPYGNCLSHPGGRSGTAQGTNSTIWRYAGVMRCGSVGSSAGNAASGFRQPIFPRIPS